MAKRDETELPATKVPFYRALLHPRYLGSWLVLLAAAMLSTLPQSIRHWVGSLIGSYLYKKNKKRREIVRTNLKQVFPELSEDQLQGMVREHLNWYGKALVDYSIFFFASQRRLKKQVSIIGEDLIIQIKQAEQPVILLLAHSVMLEFAVIALSANHKSFGSYKASSDPVLDWMIARSRCRFADFVVSRDAGLRPLIRAIKSQRIMIFLPDEDLGLDNAVFAPFFARQKATLTTPARLVRLGGAKAVAGFVAFDDKTRLYQLHLEEMPTNYPSDDTCTDAVALNKALESLILQSPEQYMWTMKWFKTTAATEQHLY